MKGRAEFGVDPRILGRLLLIQSTVHVIPHSSGVAEFVCHGLAEIPGVAGAGLCLDGKLAGRTEGFPQCTGDGNCPAPQGESTNAACRSWSGRDDAILMRLQCSDRFYGWIILRLATPSAFTPYQQYVQNVANVVALTIENREQQDRLERLNHDLLKQFSETEIARLSLIEAQSGLERKVQERTADLRHANELLEAEIRERQVAETALRESEERLRLAQRAAGIGIWDWDLLSNEVRWFEGQAELFGMPPDTHVIHIDDLRKLIHPDDRQGTIAATDQALQKRSDYDVDFRVIRPGGSVRWLSGKGRALYDDRGKPYRMLGVNLDITDRRQLEENLLHAQKMESIGRLAGGVAHDFNNLLTAILGYSDLLGDTLPPFGDNQACLREIRQAGERAANLTRQLLAFARRQVITPQVVDLNGIITDIEKMLRRLIGEHIELVTALAADLCRVKVDPGQFGQILLNLAVNARDAMPENGRLTIRTHNERLDQISLRQDTQLPIGLYAAVEVSDTGVGMSEDVRAHVFEPFFTTKMPGEGTGLGLASCYGIVKQSGGDIRVTSASGAGSTFTIYLPVASVQSVASPSEAPPKAAAGGSETILLVEDEPSLRSLLDKTLRRQGYKVLIASDGTAALELAERPGSIIHLLITDMVMPKMGGTRLAAQLIQQKPGIKVLFMSGYLSQGFDASELGPNAAFIQKPFAVLALTRKVRELLDRPCA